MSRDIMFPRIVIAGTQSGVGKTTVATGLMAVLSKSLRIQPFKVGPDYIDSAYHTFITGRKCRNLDGYLLSEEIIRYLFCKNSAGAQMAVVEGVMGLFDGARPQNDEGSTAQVAKILKAPVILVLDGSGMATSAAAMAAGYQNFDKALEVAGVIINRVSGEGHYRILKEAIEHHTCLRVFGYLTEEAEIELPSRHLGLVPSVEMPDLREKLGRLANMIEKTVEIKELIDFAASWDRGIPISSFRVEKLAPPGSINLAVAWDKAFNFYYWDNLDLLEDLGANLQYFSPLEDKDIPPSSQGILMGGGFPEVFAGELEDNLSMKENIRMHLAKGIPYLAECGGLMYLMERLILLDGRSFKMVGWLSGVCRMTQRLQRFGYAELELQKGCIYGQAGLKTRIHEFHHSQVEEVNEPRAYLLSKDLSQTKRNWQCGFIKGGGIAGYPHFHYYSNIELARNFMNKVGTFSGN